MNTTLAVVLSTIVGIVIIVQVLVDLFLIWKIINFEKSRNQLFAWIQAADKTLLKLHRILTPDQARRFKAISCDSCGELIEEDMTRQHDGTHLCKACKIKRAEIVDK